MSSLKWVLQAAGIDKINMGSPKEKQVGKRSSPKQDRSNGRSAA